MLEIAVSPCPNDTLAFWALEEELLPPPFPIKVHYYDLASLNEFALQASHSSLNAPFDLIKVSTHLLPSITTYHPLEIGGAFTTTSGPKLVAHRYASSKKLHELNLLVPSLHASGYALFSHLFPEHPQSRRSSGPFAPSSSPQELLYHQILDEVARNQDALGLIIHESHLQLDPELHEMRADLGALWQERYPGLPLPLGSLIAKKTLPQHQIDQFCLFWKRSLLYAMMHLPQALDFCKKHSIKQDSGLLSRYITDFVNLDSLCPSHKARQAVKILCNF